MRLLRHITLLGRPQKTPRKRQLTLCQILIKQNFTLLARVDHVAVVSRAFQVVDLNTRRISAGRRLVGKGVPYTRDIAIIKQVLHDEKIHALRFAAGNEADAEQAQDLGHQGWHLKDIMAVRN